MTDDKLAYAIDKMKSQGIVDSGDALTLGIGAITEAKVKDFFDKVVEAGVISDNIAWQDSFTTEFSGKGVGMDLK